MLIRRNRNETPGLNTTSTADISFMLLIFFLVTTSMDVDKGLLRQLPSPEPQKKELQESVLGKKHLISIESDRDANYNLYFQMQNELMEAYAQLRNEAAQKKYHRDFALLNNDQKEQVRKICPQRITESYANAMTHEDKSVDADAEEKQETQSTQEKGGAK